MKNLKKTSDPCDPSNCKNPVITLDPIGHDPSDWKYERYVFFSVQISWITRITDPSVQTNK